MKSAPFKANRKFPHISWAWPIGSRHELIVAAISPDDERAFEAIRNWLLNTDIDDVNYAELRLLAAITSRFESRLSDHPEHARLTGLQRLNWTRSRMAVAAMQPILNEMIAKGLKPMLMKGACRIALDPSAQKSRMSGDLDLLLSDDDFEQAVDILLNSGWQSERGESAFGLRGRISSIRARNFKKGKFGDIDIHRFAYHHSKRHSSCDEALFSDAIEADYYGSPILVPSPEERLAMAIGHGGWDGHTHSDWLVDIAHILAEGLIDWQKFKAIIEHRGLSEEVAIAFSYLNYDIGISIPSDVLEAVQANRRVATGQQIYQMYLAKEFEALSKPQRMIRSLVKSLKNLKVSGRNKRTDTPTYRAICVPTLGHSTVATAESFLIEKPDAFAQSELGFSLQVRFPAQKSRRRIELEINSSQRNICHLQAIHLRSFGWATTARLRGKILVEESDFPLTISALPTKYLNEFSSLDEHEKYCAVPFELVKYQLRPIA